MMDLRYVLAFAFLFGQLAATPWSTVSTYAPACQEAAGTNAPCTRHHPVTFSNGIHGYLGLGNGPSGNFKDFYRYDAAADSWTAIPDYPLALGFAYGVSSFGVRSDNPNHTPAYAYVGFGSDGNGYPKDFYRFDFLDESFTRLADFIGDGRNHPAMVITVDETTGEDDKVFVGCGSNGGGNLNDWYSYDIASDAWEKLPDLPGEVRHHPYYFSIDGKAFVGLGHGNPTATSNPNVLSDIFRWYGGAWTQVQDIPTDGKVAGTQFSYGGFGYVLSGDGPDHGYLPTGELWEYDMNNDSWTNLDTKAHPGVSRWAPGCFLLAAGGVTDVYFTSGKDRQANLFKDDVLKLPFAVASPTTSPTDTTLIPTMSTVSTATPATASMSPTSSPTETTLIPTMPTVSTATPADDNLSQAFRTSIAVVALFLAPVAVLFN